LERRNGWAELEKIGQLFEAGTREALARAGLNYTFQRIGSMFCLYFTGRPVHNLGDAQHADRAAFARFFHVALKAGVYFAPSQFEAGFISLAHTPADIDQTARIVSEALLAA